MVTVPQRTLDFPLLDDLMLVAPTIASNKLATITPIVVDRLGPLVEYAFHQRRRPGTLPLIESFLPDPRTAALKRTLTEGTINRSTSLEPHPFEFATPPNDTLNSHAYWRAFMQRLARAAESSGFDKSTSKGLAGALGELEDNARIHSMNVDSVIVCYQWFSGMFEMVIADAGIGILESLRSNRDYQTLQGHGQALKTALSPGETRFGKGLGHGTGFDSVFRNIAGLNGCLRFRTGDHSLELDGKQELLVNPKLRQRQYFQGFTAAFICRPSPEKLT